MNCKNKGCARQIDDDSIYCKWCGTRQVREKRTKDTAPAVKQLPSGSWYCRIRVNGQDLSITRPTRAEAIAEATAVKLGGKQADAPAKMSLSEAYDAYITDRSGTISPSTEAGYRRLARNTFQNLMPRQVGSLTADQIQREVSAMAKTASAKYVRNAEGLLMSVLRQYRPDFTPRLLLPQKTKPDLRQLSDDEIGAVLAAFRGSEVELPVLMALWMGMRMSGSAIYKRFIRGLDAAGIPRCRFHDLRHANAAINAYFADKMAMENQKSE